MFTVTFRLKGWSDLPAKSKRTWLLTALHLLAIEDAAYLTENPNTPSIYNAGVSYMPEPESCPVLNPQFGRLEQRCETWCDIPEAIARKKVDCKVLASWRLAELWRAGERDAKPGISQSTLNGQIVYHMFVVRGKAGGYRKEDPSAKLGMGQ